MVGWFLHHINLCWVILSWSQFTNYGTNIYHHNYFKQINTWILNCKINVLRANKWMQNKIVLNIVLNWSIWAIDETLTGATTLWSVNLRVSAMKRVPNTPQRPRTEGSRTTVQLNVKSRTEKKDRKKEVNQKGDNTLEQEKIKEAIKRKKLQTNKKRYERMKENWKRKKERKRKLRNQETR